MFTVDVGVSFHFGWGHTLGINHQLLLRPSSGQTKVQGEKATSSGQTIIYDLFMFTFGSCTLSVFVHRANHWPIISIMWLRSSVDGTWIAGTSSRSSCPLVSSSSRPVDFLWTNMASGLSHSSLRPPFCSSIESEYLRLRGEDDEDKHKRM